MKDGTLMSMREFSGFTGVKASALRYYEDIGLLDPAVRLENNYRYYNPLQIFAINFINVLTDLGVSLSTILEAANERTPESMIELLRHQETQLDYRMRELATAFSILHTYRNNIQDGLLAKEGTIDVKWVDEQRIIMGQVNHFKEGESFYAAFREFCRHAEEIRINLRYPIGAYHENVEDFFREPGRPTRWFSLDPFGNTSSKAGYYLEGYTRGYYGVFGLLPDAMKQFAQKNNLVFDGPAYAIYLHDEISVVDPDEYLVRVSALLTEESAKAYVGKQKKG